MSGNPFSEIRKGRTSTRIASISRREPTFGSFQADAWRSVGVEVEPADVWHDFVVSMASREFAKPRAWY